MPKHMDPHPLHSGYVWDANFRKYIPQPTPAEITNNDMLAGYYIGRPDVKEAQEGWGQTEEEQEAKSALLKTEAIGAGVEFDS